MARAMADDPNPYTSPRDKSSTAEKRKRLPSRLGWLLLCPTIGVCAGATLLAPLVTGPGDPTGRFVGASLGGLIGLAIGVWLRALTRR